MRNLSAEAQIVGSNSVSALDLQRSASPPKKPCRPSQSSPHHHRGHLYRRWPDCSRSTPGARASAWQIPGDADGQSERTAFRKDEVIVRQPIVFQGKRLGYVYIRSDLTETGQRLEQYGGIAGHGAAVLAVAGAAAVGHLPAVGGRADRGAGRTPHDWFRKNATIPFAPLPPASRDEIAVLIDAFNNMLAQIQQRDAALQAAQAELERRVDDRTRQLMAANRELEAFSYSVSHDLRGPLEVINGFSYILSVEHGADAGSGGAGVRAADRAASRRMAELIDDLLNLSRVSTTSMHEERVDLSRMAREIADQLCRQEPSRRVEFTIHDCEPVEGDSRLLRIAHGKPAAQRLEVHLETRAGAHRSSAAKGAAAGECSTFATTARDLIPPTPTVSSSPSSVCTPRANSRVPASAWPRFSASSRATAERSGREGAVEQGATFYFAL